MRFKTAIIFIGDFFVLYSALAATLLIRYGINNFEASFASHFKPFSLIFFIWVAVFYLADLYQIRIFKDKYFLIRAFVSAIFISSIISVIFFYLFDSFYSLTPKTNLFVFAIIFGILDYVWRLFLLEFFISKTQRIPLLIIGSSQLTKELLVYLRHNLQLGYDVVSLSKNEADFYSIKGIILDKGIKGVIVPSDLEKEPKLAKIIYQLLPLEVKVINFREFYELVCQKIPLEELEESWFVEKIEIYQPSYDTVKRIIDVSLSFILIIVFFPLFLFCAVSIKLSSSGPALFQHKRIGKMGRSFTFYKLRTMAYNAGGPSWTIENDERITGIGKILRYLHLDELPQLYNILKGDISFMGPRPESSELVELYKQLPYYNIRHIIKPGLTGWAQLNYKASASIEEAFEKLKYDIYYIKNRSLFLDLLIIFQTLKLFFVKK